VHQSVRRVSYELREVGDPTVADVLAPLTRKWLEQRS
jgi:hypothetical protein